MTQQIPATSIAGALLRIDAVCSVVSLSRATIYRLMAAGTFPQPVRITPRCMRWRAEDIAAWSAAQVNRAACPGSRPTPASSAHAAP